MSTTRRTKNSANSNRGVKHRRTLASRLLIATASAAIVLLAGADQAAAAGSKSLCVFDPGGATGDLYSQMKKYSFPSMIFI